ncbi:hypothetical protein RI054_11g58790 [Pseudoscourfieldia marina]
MPVVGGLGVRLGVPLSAQLARRTAPRRLPLVVARKQSTSQRKQSPGGSSQNKKRKNVALEEEALDVSFESKLAKLKGDTESGKVKSAVEEEDPDAAILPVPEFLKAATRESEPAPVNTARRGERTESDADADNRDSFGGTPPPLWLTIAAPLVAIVAFYIGGALLTNLVGTLLFPVIFSEKKDMTQVGVTDPTAPLEDAPVVSTK